MQELKIDGQFLEKEEVATRRRKGPACQQNLYC